MKKIVSVVIASLAICAFLIFPQDILANMPTTFCQDGPGENWGYCTREDPESSNQSCVPSETMRTCDGAG